MVSDSQKAKRRDMEEMSEAEAKRRKVRKGTHSCWECECTQQTRMARS